MEIDSSATSNIECIYYIKRVDNNKLCSICMCEEDGQWDRYMLKCGHVFHTRCFRLWCHQKGRVNCSVCGDTEGNPEFYYCSFCREYGHNIGAQGEGRCKELRITLTRGYTLIVKKENY